jgi:hypothetical protein
MTKRSAAAEADHLPRKATTDGRLAPWLKCVLSVLLALHVLAVFVPPFIFASTVEASSSPFADALGSVFAPYTAAMYLDHGYFFFAPNPGPTHLVDYVVEFEDGREPVQGRFPDLAKERPRLLYHRQFMMSEALNNVFTPPEGPAEPAPPPSGATDMERERYRVALLDYHVWQFRRRQYQAIRASMEEHLLAAHGGSKVTLTRVEHRPSFPWEVRHEKKSLADSATYQDLPESRPAPAVRRPAAN